MEVNTRAQRRAKVFHRRELVPAAYIMGLMSLVFLHVRMGLSDLAGVGGSEDAYFFGYSPEYLLDNSFILNVFWPHQSVGHV